MKNTKGVVLDNGLTVILDRFSHPKHAVLIGARFGPVDETGEMWGAAHLIEHMMFKSNRHRTKEEVKREMEWSGAAINGETTSDYSYISCYALNGLEERTIQTMFESVSNPSYLEDEFENEKNVIISESGMYTNDAISVLYGDMLVSVLLKDTPYCHPVEGTPEILSRMAKGQVEEMKARYWVPNNIVIVVSGGFNQKDALRTIEKTFGRMEPAQVPSRMAFEFDTAEDLSMIEMQVYARMEQPQAYLAMGYRMPSVRNPDNIKIELLEHLLSGCMSSRLWRLRDNHGIGYSISSGYDRTADIGMLIFGINGFDPERYNEAIELILGEFAGLKEEPVDKREMEGTITNRISLYQETLINPTERALAIFEKETYKMGYDLNERVECLKRVTPEEIMETATKYLTDNFAIASILPKGYCQKYRPKREQSSWLKRIISHLKGI